MSVPRTKPSSRPARSGASAQQVLDHLPYGVVVTDRHGWVRDANAAAGRLLWDIERGGAARRCRDIFACRRSGGPCTDGCLVQRAATAGEPLPEIRIDSAEPEADPSAFWVTAASLGEGTGVVLHLRPGDARDRRRRSEPHWLSGPQLHIRALGRMWVDAGEGPLGGQWLHQRPGQLLKYLVCERNRVVHAE